jgi:hypothetical protein
MMHPAEPCFWPQKRGKTLKNGLKKARFFEFFRKRGSFFSFYCGFFTTEFAETAEILDADCFSE